MNVSRLCHDSKISKTTNGATSPVVIVSGYQDLNLGPPAPKAGALPDCATSRILSVKS